MTDTFTRTVYLRFPPRTGRGGYQAFDVAGPDDPPPAMLEVRLKSGARFALGYAWLSRAVFDPTGAVTLLFSGPTVILIGRNLHPVFEAVTAHLALWVAEADQPAAALAAEDVPVVESAEYVEPVSESRAP